MEIKEKIKHKKVTNEKLDKQFMLNEEQESIYTKNRQSLRKKIINEGQGMESIPNVGQGKLSLSYKDRQSLLKKIINEGQGMESIPNVGQGKQSLSYKGRQFLLKKIINEGQGIEFIPNVGKLMSPYPINISNSYLRR